MVDNQDQEDVNSNPILQNQKHDKFSSALRENKMRFALKTSQDEEIGVDIEGQTKNQSKNINKWVHRGIQPASSSVVLSDSDKKQVLTNSGEENESEPVIDLAESLKGWPRVTARRGRRAVEAAEQPPEGEVSTSGQFSFSVEHGPLEILAAENLMLLSQGNSIFGNHGFSKHNSDSKPNKRKTDEIDHQPPSDDAEETALKPVNKSDGEDQSEIKNTEHYFDETAESNPKMQRKNNNKKQKRKRRKLSDLKIAEKLLTPEPAKDKKYECRDCGATFKTYQAFGGHRANHKKRMIVIHDADKSGNYCDIPAKPRVRRKVIKNVVEERKENYDCMICNKKFANSEEFESHQMSAHRSSGSGCSSGMDFDLNELPPQSGSD